MSLETKSIHDLRAHAQALGIKFSWGDDRAELLKAIDETIRRKIQPPEPAPLI